MKLLFKIAICILTASSTLSADEIHMTDGSIITGKITSVTIKEIFYIPEGNTVNKKILRADVLKILYEDWHEIIIPENEKLLKEREQAILEKEKKESVFYTYSFIWETPTEPLILPLLLRLSYLYTHGDTKIKVFDDDEKKIADGKAQFSQHLFKLSYEPVNTDFYITPELGYFYRSVMVKDYSYSVESENTSLEGYIPGIITIYDPENPDSIHEVSKESISSLKYKAYFHSFFLDLKAGAHLVFGPEHIQFIVNPYAYVSLAELRKSIFEFNFYNRKENYSSPYTFNVISSYGYGLEAGIYDPIIRFGFKFGLDRRYFKRYELADGIVFKEVYDDEINGMSIKRTRERKAKYSTIDAFLITMDFFIFI